MIVSVYIILPLSYSFDRCKLVSIETVVNLLFKLKRGSLFGVIDSNRPSLLIVGRGSF